MYLGWKKDHPGLDGGTTALDGMGPSGGNMYYNYYATQVMHHYGGERWERWNGRMRDQLVNSQARAGHEDGSWYFGGGDHGGDGGEDGGGRPFRDRRGGASARGPWCRRISASPGSISTRSCAMR